jgi:hypothetical protein
MDNVCNSSTSWKCASLVTNISLANKAMIILVSCHAFNLLVEIGQRKQRGQREQDLFLTSKYAV